MAVFKIYVSGNYFYLEDNSTGQLFSAFKKDVVVLKSTIIATSYNFKGIQGISPSREIAFSDILDEAGDPYTNEQTFVDFYELETGFSPASGSSGAPTSFTWAVSDEDSPLSSGLLYTTEAIFETKSFNDVNLSLKNSPTNNSITVDLKKETAVNSNSFLSIFSTPPVIDVNEFISQTSSIIPVFSDTVWEINKRMQIFLTNNDANFAATGLKVTLSA